MIEDLHPVDKNGAAYKHWDEHWNYSWDDHDGVTMHCPKYYAGHMVVNRNEVTCPTCHRDIAAYIAMKMENAK